MNQSIRKSAQSGFTLVEVIVVAIIVAALAAVAVPMYTNYVSSSRTNAAANAAGSVASFMGACLNQEGEVGGITAATLTDGETAITLTCDVGGEEVSTMQLPVGIKFNISVLDGPGEVKATHADGGVEQLYKY